MIIKSIELENIRSYKKEIIIFDNGINFLSGDIGSGKSTILLAIEFAFFGFKKGDIEGFELLRKGEINGSIKLILEENNNLFEIYRSVKKQKSSNMILQEVGYIKDKSNLIELTPKELNAYIFNLLNFPKEFLTKNKNLVYRFSVYTPQENLKSILFDSVENRLEVIRKIFGIDKYKQLSNSFDIFLKNIREDKKVFDVKLEMKSKIVAEIKDLKKEITFFEVEIKKLKFKDLKLKEVLGKYKIAIEKRENLIDRLSKNLLVLEKRKSVILEVEEQIIKLRSDILKIESNKKSFNEKNLLEMNKKIVEKILKVELKLKNLNVQKQELKNSLKFKDDFLNKKQKLEKNIILFENKKLEILKLKDSFDYMLTKCQLKDLENFILKDKLKIKKLEKLEIEFNNILKTITKVDIDLNILKDDLSKLKLKIKNISKINFCDCCLQKVSKEHRLEIEKNLKKEILLVEKSILSKTKEILTYKKKESYLESEVLLLNSLRENLIQKEEQIKSLQSKELMEKGLENDLKKLRIEFNKFDNLDLKKNLENLNNEILKFKSLELEQEKIEILRNELLDKISINKDEMNNIKQNILNSKNLDDNFKKNNDLLLILIDKIDDKVKIFEKISNFEIKEKKLKKEVLLFKEKYDIYYLKNNEVHHELVKFETNLKSKIEEINKFNKELIEIKKIEVEYSKLLFNENFLKTDASEILLRIERSVFSKYYVEFNDEFEKLFRELIEDNDIDVRLNSEFSPVIEQNGYDIDIRNLSGGEKSSLAIAYRLGLKKIIESNFDSKQKLSLLILDEPTDGFSNEQIDRLGNILKDTKLKQIILVSHDDKIESIADKILHVEKINHISKIIRI